MKNIPVRQIKATAKEAPIFDGFSIRDVSVLLDGKDMVQELHRHDFFYILALKKGAGRHEIDFVPYDVHDHAVFVMRPGQVHQHTLKARSAGYLIEFKPDFYHPHDKVSAQPLRKASAVNWHPLDASRFNKLFPLLTYIFEEYTEKQEGYGEVIKANLGIFFIELVRQNSKPPSTPVNSYAQERLEDFLELLETHIASHKQVADYGEMMNLSPYQLNAITKATLGKTCSELINEHIILESKRYLLATSNQVNQVAYHLGYEDVSYFIRFFKKHTGHSPEAFRHNFR
ncbi:AraC-type DNA-binding protein [Chryseolinea serpens]|uniref:AraC-type DNA-binding protein n=1 Tax=Chryseolinea serpens TaxID=947013 RepID=A0A1M5RBQ4_9BACT|nr:AraC family transcriptional regulator [Chryseolinea serpens]SHH23588.1 AraC-type DNA-binding protein [Chryseolinea serpens]